jgi:hypothetical protein
MQDRLAAELTIQKPAGDRADLAPWSFDRDLRPAFCFNAPRWISCIGPLIAGTLIVSLGGYGPAATIVGLFFILGIVAAPFLPETNGEPLPETLSQAGPQPVLTS